MPPSIILSILFLLITHSPLAQIPKHLFNGSNAETYEPKNFSSNTISINQRIGTYHFGDSEGEWDLIVLRNGDSLIIQIWTGNWGMNHYKKETWLRKCQTFNKVIVKGNKLYFGNFSGQFADHKEDNITTRALLLFSDPIYEKRNFGKDSAEVGFYSTNLNTFYGDRDYYILSLSVLPETYFSKKSKQELKLMRNAIYAKYGLIFQEGGDMEKYFTKKDWYNPYQKDVSACLTAIEKKNIQTISRLEQN